MGRSKLSRIATAALILAFLATGETTVAQQTKSTRSGAVAATIEDEVISLEEVSQSLHGQLAQIERQRYSLLSQKLQQLIDERLCSGKQRSVA